MAVSLPPGVDLSMIPSMAPPPGVLPNFIDPVTLADSIVAVCAATSVLAVILLCMRLYSTTKITRSASYDDAASVIALILSLCYAGLIISTRDNTRHGWDFPISAYTSSFAKIVFTEQIFAALSLLFSKASILLLLFRLFGPTRWFRYMVYLGLAWVTVICLVSVIVASVLCAPRRDEHFEDLAVAKRCTHESTWAVVQGTSDVVVDFYIIYLPIPMLMKLNMGFQRKLGVMAIFLTGFVACIASILGLVYKIQLLRSSDALWNAGRIDITNIVELNVAIMVACMPACACFSRYFFANHSPMSLVKKSRFSSPRSSRHRRFSHSRASTMVASAGRPSESFGDTANSKASYWKIKNPFHNGGDNAAPQITMNDKRSRVLQTGDFDVFNDSKGFDKAEPGSIELQTPLSEGGKGSPMAPYDMV